MYKPEYPGLYYFDTFTFTTLGTSGHRGPDSTKAYANAPWRDGDFSIVDGQQQWTVPATGTYRIEAAGAYGATPGRVVSGDVDLYEGQTLTMLVGQQPTPLTANVADNLTVGGGGGTFIVSDGTPLIVASGGDGTGGHTASFSPYGTGNGINGAGYFSNGSVTNVTFRFLKPTGYLDGGFGNIYIKTVVPEEGGFGGGQSPVATGISGGGGYTGSPGNGTSGATCYADSSVANFTDLGATGNTAGTVTISLIDPVPLKQTWTWDQTFTNTSPKLPFQVVNWSDKLGIFQSYTGKSSDGIHWNGDFISLILEQTQGQPTPPFYTAYSNTLNLYIGYEVKNFNPIYITSNDGVMWTETTPVGMDLSNFQSMYNGSNLLWAPELNLFVCVLSPQILTSYDGINWTERYYDPSLNSARSIAYSPSIHTFVCIGSWSTAYTHGTDTGLYSTDGITWTKWSTSYPIIYEDQIVDGRGISVTWSPKLNIFLSCVRYDISDASQSEFTQITYMARSTDGQTWTTTENIGGENFLVVLWGEGLDVFTAIPQIGSSIFYSYDGITWSTTYAPVKGQIAYSPTLQIFVVSDSQGFRQFISIDGIYYVDIAKYYPKISGPFTTWASQIGTAIKQDYYSGSVSTDGTLNWEKAFGTQFELGQGVTAWSPELGLYVSLAYGLQVGSDRQIISYYSRDGKTWIDTSFKVPISAEPSLMLPYVSWSPTLGVFSGAFYSKDGINWQQSSVLDCTASGWSSFHKMFAEFYYANVYYSYDGTTWNTGNNIPGFSGFGVIACSSNGRFVCQAGTYIPFNGDTIPITYETFIPEGVMYSDDGINWISGGAAFVLSTPIWIDELSVFVASYWNRWGDNDSLAGWVSSDGINWDTIGIQPTAWSPELGRILCTGGYSPVSKTF